MKKGDRVRVCWIDDYSAACGRQMGVKSHIGRTGTVVETRYNPNMAGYGMGNEVLVRMDDTHYKHLWIDKNLEVING